MTPRSIPLALLAGGLATRLKPTTEKIPKSMIEVEGEPFISHQLRLLKREGLEKVIICAGHLGQQIQDFVGNGSSFGLKTTYSFDGDRLLGTGGALVKALPVLGENFWVMYGDSYLDIALPPILDRFLTQDSPALITVLFNNNQWDRSNVSFRDGRILSYDKHTPSQDMRHIDYGLGILTKQALRSWKLNQAFDLAEVYASLANQGKLLGYEVYKRFYEIGSLQGLEETRHYIKNL